MSLYEVLRRELSHARRLMVTNYGRPEHSTYKQLVRLIEGEIKTLTVYETISA